MDILQKAYDWALHYSFEEVEVEYASKLALKMLDDACKMGHEERKIFFYVYDALCDREDITLNDEMNQLIKLARNRQTIFSKPKYAPYITACRKEIIPLMMKKDMKAYKKLVRSHLGLL